MACQVTCSIPSSIRRGHLLFLTVVEVAQRTSNFVFSVLLQWVTGLIGTLTLMGQSQSKGEVMVSLLFLYFERSVYVEYS